MSFCLALAKFCCAVLSFLVTLSVWQITKSTMWKQLVAVIVVAILIYKAILMV